MAKRFPAYVQRYKSQAVQGPKERAQEKDVWNRGRQQQASVKNSYFPIGQPGVMLQRTYVPSQIWPLGRFQGIPRWGARWLYKLKRPDKCPRCLYNRHRGLEEFYHERGPNFRFNGTDCEVAVRRWCLIKSAIDPNVAESDAQLPQWPLWLEMQ